MSGRRKKSKSKSRPRSVPDHNATSSTLPPPSSSMTRNLNFSIKTSPVMGRYMVAEREFKPGEIILSELPMVVGPCTGCKVQCIACYQTLDPANHYTKCGECGWPLCATSCPAVGQKYGHSLIECTTLRACNSRAGLDYDDFDALRDCFNALVPLRCLLLKRHEPAAYAQLMAMEHHNAIRQKIPEVWNTNQKLIVNRIVDEWGLVEFGADEIHTICGILEVNSFEIGQQGVNIRGLYPNAFLMSHNCVPNTSHSDEEKEFRLTVRASTPIHVQQPITISYAYTLQSTLKRREHLLENKFFLCMCERCKDPSECGTYTGALRCPKCVDGLVLSVDPLDADAAWQCNGTNCPGYKISAKSMELLLARIGQDIDKLATNDIRGMEMVLEKYRNVLHPTHYLCLEIKLSLSQLYGKINGYIIHELSNELLERKMEICREIIKIFDIIEPGFTRLRGVTLYELHAPIFILATRQYENGALNKAQLRFKIREIVRYLEEACAILGHEPETSSEGIMGVAARDALDKMREWCRLVGRL